MVKHGLIYAKNECGVDAFNCLEIMENPTFFKECKFARGSGMLNYYMFNYDISAQYMPGNKIGTLLV